MEEKYLIGNKIRELRKRTGLTLKELSERMSISVTYLSEVERGQTKANDKIFTGIFREFGVNIADLMSGVPEPEDAEAKPVRQHIAINGLSCVKVEALKDLAEKLKETGDTEFFDILPALNDGVFRKLTDKLMGTIFMTLRDAGIYPILHADVAEAGRGRDRLHFAPCGAAEHQQGCGPG